MEHKGIATDGARSMAWGKSKADPSSMQGQPVANRTSNGGIGNKETEGVSETTFSSAVSTAAVTAGGGVGEIGDRSSGKVGDVKTPAARLPLEPGERAIAKNAFHGNQTRHLSFEKDTIILLKAKLANGWWQGSLQSGAVLI